MKTYNIYARNDQGVTIRAAKRKRRKRRSIRCCIGCKKPTLRWYENKAPRIDEIE